MEYTATAFLQRRPSLIRRLHNEGAPVIDRRRKMPDYDAKKDGNVFDWLVAAVGDVRTKQELGRRVTDKPERLRKL